MRDGNHEPIRAQAGGVPSRRAVQVQNRLATRLVLYFDVSPAHAAPPSCAERFHGSFFGCESRCVALEFAFVPLAILNFRGRKYTFEESASVARDCFLQTVNLRDVHSQTNDQLPSLAPEPFANIALLDSLRTRIIPIIKNVREIGDADGGSACEEEDRRQAGATTRL